MNECGDGAFKASCLLVLPGLGFMASPRKPGGLRQCNRCPGNLSARLHAFYVDFLGVISVITTYQCSRGTTINDFLRALTIRPIIAVALAKHRLTRVHRLHPLSAITGESDEMSSHFTRAHSADLLRWRETHTHVLHCRCSN